MPTVLAVAALLLLAPTVVYGRSQGLFGGSSINGLRANLLARAESDFDSVNKKAFAEYNIQFKEIGSTSVSCYNSRDPLSSENNDTCTINNRANPVNADEAFISRWRKTSPAFESWLLQNGWRKTWNANQPIAEILDKPDNRTSIGVNYEKASAGIRCIVRFTWVQPHDPNQFNAAQMCVGSIN